LNLKSTPKDIFGLAVESFYNTGDPTPINVHNKDFFDDEIPVDYLFRNYANMPLTEQKAIDLCQGKVLDVGCCAGSHSLELKARNHQVLPIDISEKCIKVCQKRGLQEAKVIDFYQLQPQKFDTILLLMNGIGIAKNLENLSSFFQKLKQLMHAESKVILDSSDLIFLYEDELLDDSTYYGEMMFQTSYKGAESEPFPWLYLDYNLLKTKAKTQGFTCQLIHEDDHYGFLAQLQLS
jgi:SAM-dependent methyltransferase